MSAESQRPSSDGSDGSENSDDRDRRWLAETYRPDARQLTVRAAVAGMVLGGVMCLSNLYVVLKTGWSLGVTITACILAYAFFALLRSVGLARTGFTVLENNAMGSVASAAGFMTGGGNMAALPALFMLTGARPSTGALMLWFATIAALGVFAAIPIKRQLINVEALAFPTGTATAETLRSLHDRGGNQARALFGAAVLGGLVAWLRDAKAKWMPFHLPSTLPLPFNLAGHPAVQWTLAIEGSLLLVGAGALMSLRTGWSMLLGAVVNYGVLAPWMVSKGVIAAVSYKAIVQWSTWAGAGVLVSSGLLSFASGWRVLARSFQGLVGGGGRRGRAAAAPDPLVAIECPRSWFPIGFAILSPVVVYLMWRMFGIPWWAGIVAIPLAIVMSFVAARVTGETDTTPTKALGPITQLVYGAMLPGNITANLMGANVTGGVGLHAADLLTDLKSGFLLGARPRQQFAAQLFGVMAGAAVVVPAFNLLIPDPALLGSVAFPAPASMVWAGVAKVMSQGLHALHPTARIAIWVGGTVGVALTLLERLVPRRALPFIPSAAGFGIALVIPGFNSISMFVGALAAWLWRRRQPADAPDRIVPIAAGLIAGESLVGVGIALLTALG